MKTIGLHDDYESQGIKRSDASSGDSDNNERRHRSSGSSTERSKDKDGGSDGSTNSQRQRKLKKAAKRGNKKVQKKTTIFSTNILFVCFKVNAAGQLIGSSDSEQHRSDGNDSDGSMLNLNEDLKPISYYIKDRERMLHEMFRCVRGHKLQAILPDALKVTLRNIYKYYCDDYYYIKIVMRRRRRMNRMNFFILFFTNIFWSNFNSHKQVRLIIDPCFRLIYMIYQAFKQHRIYYRRKFCFFREILYSSPIFQI
jgi:hypothetical protein